MEILKKLTASIAVIASSAGAALASGAAEHSTVDTSLTYNSGILVLAFAGFMALVVVVQTIPAVISLYGMIKKTAEESRRETAEVSARK